MANQFAAKSLASANGTALASGARVPEVITTKTIGYRTNPPRGWHEQKDGGLVCPHRDVSVCPECVAANPEAWDCYGVHFWVPVDQRPRTDAAWEAALR